MPKIYLVGGAVRDGLMQKEISDKDYVVVGETPENMINNGFEQVGADFPVFLHPETKEEYALARTERKTGYGYNGFSTDHSVNVTIEEDLSRRDLTMNAIAKDEITGEIIDPFSGREDIKNKIIRHVSDAFKEDPLRILRVARFSARFPDYKIADETIKIMRDMHDSGETRHLTKERIWKELSRAVIYPKGSNFFKVLQEVGLGKELFPLMSGFMNDRNMPFSIARIQVSTFDKYIENLNLKEKLAHWSIPTYKGFDKNIIDMWKSLKAPNDVIDHISVSGSIWNYIYNNVNSLNKIQNANHYLFELIKNHDGFRRKERFLSAYNTVKNHFTILNNNPKCLPDVSVVSNWIDQATPTKKEIEKAINNCEKKEIAEKVKELRVNKWKKINNIENIKKLKI